MHVPEDERFGAIGLDGEELVLDWGVQKQSVPCPTVCVQPCRSEEDNSIDLFSIRTPVFSACKGVSICGAKNTATEPHLGQVIRPQTTAPIDIYLAELKVQSFLERKSSSRFVSLHNPDKDDRIETAKEPGAIGDI